MEFKEWTEAKGWFAAIGRLLLRGIVAMLLVLAAEIVIQYLTGGTKYVRGGRIGGVGLPPGVAAGHFLVRGLVNSSGIDGKLLIFPSLIVMAMAAALSALLVIAFVAEPSPYLLPIASCAFFAAIIPIIYALLTE